jgi:hypothetical protein
MSTYKSYSELIGKTLKYGDYVKFEKFDLLYKVQNTHLSCESDGYTNNKLFELLHIDSDTKRSIASIIYNKSKSTIAGDWPTFSPNDYEAATKFVLAMYQFVDGASAAQVPGKSYFITIEGKKLYTKPNKDELTVPVEFIRQAHKAACADWKQKLEKQFPSLFIEEMFKLGTRLRIYRPGGENEEFLLARKNSSECVLICLENGNPWDSMNCMLYTSEGCKRSDLEKYIEKKFDILLKK